MYNESKGSLCTHIIFLIIIINNTSQNIKQMSSWGSGKKNKKIQHITSQCFT